MSKKYNVKFCILLLLSFVQLQELFAEDVESKFNSGFGAVFFNGDSIWNENVEDVAQRFGWPLESKTSTEISYREYANEKKLVLGCRPYSLVLYGEDGLASSISMVFANKGDAVIYTTDETSTELKREAKKQSREYKRQITKDKSNLKEMLSGYFGNYTYDAYGQSAQTREKVLRWDYEGSAFLLAAPRDEYVCLRIMPVASADNGGKSRISDTEIRSRVQSRVEERSNGDVILKDMPMVNQGPKGYCVPATWERVMRYMGVPADMYILAMAGDTQVGGGTSMDSIQDGAKQAVIRAGRRIENKKIKIDPVNIARYIDKGLPIIWAMYSTQDYNQAIDSRSKDRLMMKDPKTWQASIAGARRLAKKFKRELDAAHVCMIIGYNKITKEIAVTDSWGPSYSERWATIEEASAVSQGYFQVINF